MKQERVRVNNEQGLHARSASELVRKANQFESEIVLEYNGKEASAKSILAVLSLAAEEGNDILLKARGRDEDKAIITLRRFIE